MPKRYSSPQVLEPRSDHRGSPSKSKKTSPALVGGIRSRVSASMTSERTPPSGSRSCSSWRRACSRSRSRVAARTSVTGSVRRASSSIVLTPASMSLRRVGARTPATSRRSRAASTSGSQTSHRPQASQRGSPHRPPLRGPVVEQEGVEAGPARAVHRQDVVEGEVTRVAAADDEACDGGGWELPPPEQRGIRGDLEQGGNALGARELGVADQPALRGALEEVGVTDEATVEEGRLVDHLGVGVQRVEGFGVGSCQLERAVPRPAELHDPTTVLRGAGAARPARARCPAR